MTDATFSIRYATADDAECLEKLFAEVVGNLTIYNEEARRTEINKYDLAALRTKIGEDPLSISIAVNDEEILGYCITTDQHGPIWIDWYGVAEGARRAGIGYQLIWHLISELPSRSATKIWCDTRTNNVPSIVLFEKMGFRQLCMLKDHWYGQDFYLWELILQQRSTQDDPSG